MGIVVVYRFCTKPYTVLLINAVYRAVVYKKSRDAVYFAVCDMYCQFYVRVVDSILPDVGYIYPNITSGHFVVPV